VEGLALEPNGDILATVGYGNNGCWGAALAMLQPSGRPVPQFARRLDRFWHRLRFGAFVGGVYTDGDGFTLVGTGQRPCANGPSFSAPSATGLITRFRTNGEPISPTIRFQSRMYGDILAFRDGDDIFVVGSPYANSTQLMVTARRPDGSADTRFGSHGRARIRTPWKGPHATLDSSVLVNKASPRTMVVIATQEGRKELRVIRVHL